MQNFIIAEEDALKLGAYLKEKRKEKSLTIAELEARSGINRADIHRLESGQKKRLNPFQLVSLAETLEINLIELYILVGFINKKAISDFVEKKTDERINEQLKIISYTGAIKIPIYENFESALGFTKNVSPVKYTTLFLNGKKEYFGVIVNDDNLKPFLYKDAIVIVEKTKEIDNGETGLFSINNEFFIRKYLQKETINILYDDRFPSEPIIVIEKDDFKFYGKIVVAINIVH